MKRFAGVALTQTNTNADGTTHATEPLGLLYVLGIAKKEGWNTNLFDLSRQGSIETLVEKIAEYRPDVVGLSVDDISRNTALKVANAIKEKTKATILFGGYYPSACPEIVQNEGVDYVIAGEAEIALPAFLRTFPSVSPEIPNVAYKRDSGFAINRVIGRMKREDPDILPIRDEFYLRQKEYTLTFPAPSDQTGVAQVIINRGCTFSCNFCSSSGIYGRKFERRSIDDALDEIASLKGRGVNLIVLNDLDITLDKKFTEEFCDRIEARGLNSNLYFETFGNTLTTTPELLEKLYSAGVRKIGYGIESLDQEVLQFIGKRNDAANLKDLLDKGFDLGILTSGFYQIGYPMETEESVRKHVDLLIENELFIPRLRLVIATPTSGTPWHKQIQQEFPGWPSETAWDQFDTQNLVYPHSNFTSESLVQLRDSMQERYYASDLYQGKLEQFLKKHEHLKKSFSECGWKV